MLAEAPAQGVPPGGATLLASAFDIGFHVAQCLLRPPELEQRIPTLKQGGAPGSDTDDVFAELVDEVQVLVITALSSYDVCHHLCLHMVRKGQECGTHHDFKQSTSPK